jgi:thiamine-phosphate pyrophosphorylase
MPAAAVRSLFSGEIRVGRSVHSAAEAAAISRAGGIDYLIFGTMFPTRSKAQSNPLATLDELALVCRAVAGLPVLAIGGLTLERASVVARAGAAGVAGIGLFIPPRNQDPDRYFQLLVRDLRRAFDTCGAVP